MIVTLNLTDDVQAHLERIGNDMNQTPIAILQNLIQYSIYCVSSGVDMKVNSLMKVIGDTPVWLTSPTLDDDAVDALLERAQDANLDVRELLISNFESNLIGICQYLNNLDDGATGYVKVQQLHDLMASMFAKAMSPIEAVNNMQEIVGQSTEPVQVELPATEDESSDSAQDISERLRKAFAAKAAAELERKEAAIEEVLNVLRNNEGQHMQYAQLIDEAQVDVTAAEFARAVRQRNHLGYSVSKDSKKVNQYMYVPK